MKQIRDGLLIVEESSATSKYGSPTEDLLESKIVIADPAAYRRMILGSTIGAAESYIDGQWAATDLTALIRIMIRNMDLINQVDRSSARIRNAWHWCCHLLRRNTVRGSRRNIHEHYDLGNDFYKLFLDPTMSYSSAIFDDDSFSSGTLDAASRRKIDVVGEKLRIQASHHVLEIGTGWGGLAIQLASTTGCRVTTTTISQEQYDYATKAVATAGLSDKITILKQDYRSLTGSYDKIVSIEMVEAVGHQYFDQFFAQCSNLLKPQGNMLLQGIMIAGQHYASHIRKVDFIRRYIFPGGCLPSVNAVTNSIDRATDLQTTHLEDLTSHYVLTLQHWRRSFMGQLGKVRALGYEEEFIRLWHFYLCYCEAAFAERRVNLVQMVFDKP